MQDDDETPEAKGEDDNVKYFSDNKVSSIMFLPEKCILIFETLLLFLFLIMISFFPFEVTVLHKIVLNSFVNILQDTDCGSSSLGILKSKNEQMSSSILRTSSLDKKGTTVESNFPEPSYSEKSAGKRVASNNEMAALIAEKDPLQAKIKTQALKNRQTQSGPLMPGTVLTHSRSERSRIPERFVMSSLW